MKDRLIPILVTLCIIAVGHIIKRKRYSHFVERKSFTIDFCNNLIELSNYSAQHHKMDAELYAKCSHDVDKAQDELGGDGVIGIYYDPIRQIQMRDYPLFLNILPEMREMCNNPFNSVVQERFDKLMGYCEDALHRHVGNLDRLIESEGKGIWNPVVCFAAGIRWIIGLPFNILNWCGILADDQTEKIHGNIIFKIIGHFITLVGLLDSTISIILGWDGALAIVKAYLSK